MFGVRVARVKSAGSNTFPDLSLLIILRQPIGKRKKEAPLLVHGVWIATLAETQQSAQGV